MSEVVITAGGTRENIDDVRYIGNFSGGKLGHSLASAYAELGHSVLLLAPDLVVDRFGLPDGVEHESFTSAASLRQRLISVPSARLVLQAAAVSDYTPVPVEGKISSDEDELVIHLRRTPKILPTLRDHFGEDTKIVGFKLLSDVEESTLITAAIKQMLTCRTDLCIANDLQDIGVMRRVHIVSPDGDHKTLFDDTQAVAEGIAETISVPEVSYV